MSKLKTTVILHEKRERLSLSLNEYVLLDTIHRFSEFRHSKTPGWCNAKKETLGEMIGLSKRSIISLINKLFERELILKDDGGKLLKTTKKWVVESDENNDDDDDEKEDENEETGEESSPDASEESSPENGTSEVKKVHPSGEESSPEQVKKVHPSGEESSPAYKDDNSYDSSYDNSYYNREDDDDENSEKVELEAEIEKEKSCAKKEKENTLEPFAEMVRNDQDTKTGLIFKFRYLEPRLTEIEIDDLFDDFWNQKKTLQKLGGYNSASNIKNNFFHWVTDWKIEEIRRIKKSGDGKQGQKKGGGKILDRSKYEKRSGFVTGGIASTKR